METHAHDLHNVPGRGWKHYFFEFFMLFMAVFCGFLAENIRELYVEKLRSEEYTLSLYRDIKTDTVIFKQTEDYLTLCITNIDSLLDLLKKPDSLQSHSKEFYKYSAMAFIFPVNKPNEATLQQFMNSGSLRYLKNSVLADSIKAYNTIIQLFNSFDQSCSDFNIEFRKILPDILDVSTLIHDVDTSKRNNLLQNLGNEKYFNNSKLLTNNGDLLKRYAGWCALKKFYFQNSIGWYEAIKTSGSIVLKMVEKEYHPE